MNVRLRNKNCERKMNEVGNILLHPTKLWSRVEILGRSSAVPKEPGIYAWYFREIPPLVPIDRCVTHEGLTLLYIGISPQASSKKGKESSKQNLSTRLKFHMNGNAYGSTLRLSLGCLLSKQLGIQLRRVGSGKRRTFADGEKKLSSWLEQNAFVIWAVTSEPWLIETDLLKTVSLPVNLAQNDSHVFHAVLSTMRKNARALADELPVLDKIS